MKLNKKELKALSLILKLNSREELFELDEDLYFRLEENFPYLLNIAFPDENESDYETH